MVAGTVNWTNLREFRAVDLTRSFVLSWEFNVDSLLIDLDLALCPEHAFYEQPRPSESACFRPAILEFPGCTKITNPTAPDALDNKKLAEVLEHGKIYSFKLVADGEYVLGGEFGDIGIIAERPLLRLKGQLV